MQRILIAVVLALSAAGASAQVHKCVDAKGKISYSETPCSAAERGGQVLGSEATEKRWEPDGTGINCRWRASIAPTSSSAS